MTESNESEKKILEGWTRIPSGAYVSHGRMCVPVEAKMCECPKLGENDRCSIDNEVCWPNECDQYYWMKKREEASK